LDVLVLYIKNREIIKKKTATDGAQNRGFKLETTVKTLFSKYFGMHTWA
jgi:hypothetical protein